MVDPKSVAGKAPGVERRVSLVVVGAGPAGIAAATEAARAGIEVLLVDEHPVDVNMMAMDVPLYFGQRMSAAVRDRGTMLERVVQSSPQLEAAYDAGVDVQLGVYVWGAFRNAATVRELGGPMVGLADPERSWLVGYDRLVVAAGARDLAMGFRGWEKAGTMGAQAAHALSTRYRALATRRMVVLGSGPLGLQVAARALDRGVEVAAVVEVAPAARGDAALCRRLLGQGVRFFAAHAVKEAQGSRDEVEAVVLVALDGDGRPIPGRETVVACDTVCLAIGLVPNVELLSVLGCRLAFHSERGGWVPETDEWGRTSLPDVYAAGDCAGVHEGRVTDATVAAAQGRLAGITAAESLGALEPGRAGALRAGLLSSTDGQPAPVHDRWMQWLRSLIEAGGWDVNVCQCEEVTRRELCQVAPPRYLGWRSDRMSARSLGTLLRDGPVNQDQIKRLTRAGMGPCQGRRCREQVALLLAGEAGLPVGDIPLASYRPPLRPLPLSVLWPHDEPPAMRDHWVVWFGIPTQFAPHWSGRVEAGSWVALDK
jgi:thioredoxin reductase